MYNMNKIKYTFLCIASIYRVHKNVYNNLTRSHKHQTKQPHKEVNTMKNYHITYNGHFGFCVVETDGKNEKIVFSGSIEDCNNKCMELNSDR